MAKYKIVHYLNQFFGGIGGEEMAGFEPEVREEKIGPGLAFAQALGEDYDIVATVICGDNYFGENLDTATDTIVEMVRKYDPDVFVAGPTNLSGTAALIGAVKGYEEMTGENGGEEALEAAVNEIVVTGDLGDILGDSEAASDIIAYIKQQIAEEHVESDEDIERIIRNAMKEFNIELSDEQVQELIKLMNKISKLDLDVDALAKQAGDLYEKLKGMGLNLDDIDTEKVGNFITRFFDSIVGFFNKLFG